MTGGVIRTRMRMKMEPFCLESMRVINRIIGLYKELHYAAKCSV